MARRGHPVSAATRAKISAALRGRPHPHRGHVVTAATRAKLSAAARARARQSHPASSAALRAAAKAKATAAARAKAQAAVAARKATPGAGKHAPVKPRVPIRGTAHPRPLVVVRTHAPIHHALGIPPDPAAPRPRRPRRVRHWKALVSANRGYNRRFVTHLHLKRPKPIAAFRFHRTVGSRRVRVRQRI